jgi:hypothetical protein
MVILIQLLSALPFQFSMRYTTFLPLDSTDQLPLSIGHRCTANNQLLFVSSWVTESQNIYSMFNIFVFVNKFIINIYSMFNIMMLIIHKKILVDFCIYIVKL